MLALLALHVLAQQPAPLSLRPQPQTLAQPQTMTLQMALALVDERGVAVRAARADEEIALAQARRAFSVLLPRVDVDASYVFSCQAGADSFNCDDQTAQFVSDDFLSGQELLFHAVADGTRGQAQQVPDPARQQALLAQADDLDAAGTKIGNTDNDPIVIAPAHVVNGNLTLSVPLLVLPAWTALENADDAARFRKLAAAEARRLSRLGVTRAWLAAVQKARVVDVADDRLRDARIRRSALEAAEAVGAQSPLVTDGARLEELASEVALVDARAAAGSARARLGVLCGVEDDFIVNDAGFVDGLIKNSVSPDVAAVDAVAARAAEQRIEVKAAALQQRLADRDGRSAWQGYLPEVRGFAQVRGTTNTSGFVDAPFATGAGVSLRWNLFDGGERQGRVDVANASVAAAAARSDDALWTVRAEVRGATVEVARARAVLAVAERAVVVAGDRLRAVELAVSSGARSDVDLSAAASARAASEVDLVSARIAVALAVVSVSAAAGDDVAP